MLKRKALLAEEQEKAIAHLCQIRFHQSFILPANPSDGRPDPIRVTYSDSDYRTAGTTPLAKDVPEPDVAGPTLLIIPGMYGTRYVAAGSTDALARKHGLRLIVVDKFGLGGTGEVPLERRVLCFLEMISALLEHIDVKHVALMCHSAGTIYTLNALIHLRHILHPRNPYVCFLAPWVHTSHSGSLGALNLLPTTVISHSNGIIKFLNQNLSPVFAFSSSISSGISSGVSGLSSGITPDSSTGMSSGVATTATDGIPTNELEELNIEDEGDSSDDPYDKKLDFAPDEQIGEVFWKTQVRYLFAENTSGGADDALLCLKRGQNASWGLMNDYDDGVARILESEAKARDQGRTSSRGNAGAAGRIAVSSNINKSQSSLKPFDQGGALRVQVFFAENDSLCGDKGKVWFDQLWQQAEDLQGELLYSSETVKESSHDSIADVKYGVLDRVFADVRSTWIL